MQFVFIVIDASQDDTCRAAHDRLILSRGFLPLPRKNNRTNTISSFVKKEEKKTTVFHKRDERSRRRRGKRAYLHGYITEQFDGFCDHIMTKLFSLRPEGWVGERTGSGAGTGRGAGTEAGRTASRLTSVTFMSVIFLINALSR